MCYSENAGLPNAECKRWEKSLGEVPKGKKKIIFKELVINFNFRGLSKTFEVSMQSNGKTTQKDYTKKDLNEPNNTLVY